MTKILICGMNYAPEVAGVGRYTGEIGEYFTVQGHETIVVTTPPHYPGWKEQAPYKPHRWTKERKGRLTIVRCPLHVREKMHGGWRLIAPLTFAISSAPVVLWLSLVKRPDIMLCVEPTLLSAPTLLFAARLIGARTALHVQDLEVDASFAVGHLAGFKWLKSLAGAFERVCLRRFDKVITISHHMAGKLVEKRVAPERIEVVRNWVDLDRVHPLDAPSPYRGELGLADGDRVILYSGAIGAKQGFETVLDAAELLERRSEIKIVIAGEGPAKAALQVRSAEHRNVRFLPFQPVERLADFLGLADAHVLPQAADAADLVLPSKLGGMLASGRPIVATAKSGTELAEFVGDAVALTPPGDPRALADALIKALDAGPDEARRQTRLRLARDLSRHDGLSTFAAIVADLAEKPVRPSETSALELPGREVRRATPRV